MAQLLTREEYETIRAEAELVVRRSDRKMNPDPDVLLHEMIGLKVMRHFQEVEHTLWQDLREIGKDWLRDLREGAKSG